MKYNIIYINSIMRFVFRIIHPGKQTKTNQNVSLKKKYILEIVKDFLIL